MKRESSDSSGCSMDTLKNRSKILQGNDRTGQRASPRNSAKRGMPPNAKSRRLDERIDPPLVEKHEAVTHSLESTSKPETRISTSKASTSASCSPMQNMLYDDHHRPTNGTSKRRNREELFKAAPSQDWPEIIDMTFDD
uniref:Uncharacterized protein n=1 Tax=Trichuris muris TaxID=70415 RepID=A0A5S6QCV2_TRIMR